MSAMKRHNYPIKDKVRASTKLVEPELQVLLHKRDLDLKKTLRVVKKTPKLRALAKEKQAKIPPHVGSSDEEVDEESVGKVPILSREERKRLREKKRQLDNQLDAFKRRRRGDDEAEVDPVDTDDSSSVSTVLSNLSFATNEFASLELEEALED